MLSSKKMALGGLAAILLTFMFAPQKSEATTTNNNWASTSTSQRCSREAERYADRRARRSTVAGVGVGALAGGLIAGSAGVGALIGGGTQVVRSNSRWQTFYNRSYRQCINR